MIENVFKIGGSLATTPELPLWLEQLARQATTNSIIVPGGGPFADQVRAMQTQWQFDDNTAHDMAIHAMDQYGRMLCALHPKLTPVDTLDKLDPAHHHDKLPVWLPAKALTGNPALPASWDITSDSIAAWLAQRLHAQHLLLIKYPPHFSTLPSLQTLQSSGLIDKAFHRFLHDDNLHYTLLGRQDYLNFLETGYSSLESDFIN